MSTISISLKTPDQYEMLVRDVVVGFARRLEKGFFIELLSGESKEHATMAAAKSWVAGFSFEGIEQRADRKPLYFSIDEARTFAPLSHTKANYLLRMIKECWPYLHGNQYGAAMVLLQKIETAKWPWGQTARAWLQLNRPLLPQLRRIDWEAYNADRTVRYLEGHEWFE